MNDLFNNEIFVFGSNLAGRHGAGSAKEAMQKYGAIYGQGTGRQGNSYAIPTKDGRDGGSLRRLNQTLSLNDIETQVLIFLGYAFQHPELTFRVAAIGCGLAGYKPEQIAPLFRNHPDNVKLPPEFLNVLRQLSPQ